MSDANRLQPVNGSITRTERQLKARLKSAYQEVVALFKAIPKTEVRQSSIKVSSEVTYRYEITARELTELSLSVSAAFAQSLQVQNDLIPELWWYKDFIEPPYRQGTFDEINAYNKLVESGVLKSPTAVTIDSLTVSMSAAYLERLQKVYATNYEIIKTLAQSQAKDAFGVINRSIDAGYGVRKTVKNIQDRMSVSFFNASRIARTEIGTAYNDSKLDTASYIASDTGLKNGVMHLSALSPTTRENHARRHGKVFTPQEQRQWWNEDANRIQCKCTVETVYLDEPGLDEELEREKAKGEKYFKDLTSD